MEFKDYYKILGVKADASVDDIRRSYRKLARKYHPDVSKEADAESKFKDLSEAYEVLKDPEKRAQFDQVRAQPRGARGQWQPPPGFERGPAGFRGGGDASGFSDFFDTLFGAGLGGFRGGQGVGQGAGQRFGGFGDAGPARGADQRAAITIDLDTAHRGGTRRLTLQEPERGARSLDVRIPAGVADGQQVRLRGQGSPGVGGAAGDLLLQISVGPDPRFTLEGRDLHASLPVAPWEAALGAKVPVPTLDGPVDLKVPAGSQSGRRLRLKGRGLNPRNRSGARGDHYVTLKIVNPPMDNDNARDAYRRLAEAVPFDPRA